MVQRFVGGVDAEHGQDPVVASLDPVFETPAMTANAPNITPDPATGIGRSGHPWP